MNKKIGILGSGQVAQVLANGFLQNGFEVKIGTRDTEKMTDWKAKAGTNGTVGSFEEAATFGQLIVLAVKGVAAESIIKQVTTQLTGKTIIDATNPIAEAPPVNGVLKYFTTLEDSLMERLQRLAPSANFVKAFNCVGNQFMVNPTFAEGKPSMFICGNSDTAKADVTSILNLFGWETEDMGKVESARAIEPLCILWCLPGFTANKWSHAFKLLKL
jgi:8-hydroxy-5-deazaflavin:NADPH oxidoreductase